MLVNGLPQLCPGGARYSSLELDGSSGEFGEHQHPAALDLTGTIFFGNQVHPVLERGGQADARSTVVGDELLTIHRTEK